MVWPIYLSSAWLLEVSHFIWVWKASWLYEFVATLICTGGLQKDKVRLFSLYYNNTGKEYGCDLIQRWWRLCYHNLNTQIAEKSQANTFFPQHSKKKVDRLGRRKKKKKIYPLRSRTQDFWTSIQSTTRKLISRKLEMGNNFVMRANFYKAFSKLLKSKGCYCLFLKWCQCK